VTLRKCPVISLGILCILVGTFLLYQLSVFTVDDTFISLRYAWNLVNGYGLVWNAGEPPVEGYTNFSWVLLMAAIIKLGWDPVLIAKTIGIVTTLVIGILLSVATKRFFKTTPLTSLLAFGIWWITPAVHIHAVSGLETSLVSLCLLSETCLAILWFEQQDRFTLAFYAALLGLLGALTRPEAAFFYFVCFGFCLWAAKPAGRRILTWATLVGFILPGTVYMAWRVLMFGQLLPNTFYVKSVHGLSDITKPLLYISGYILNLGLIPMVLTVFHQLKTSEHKDREKTSPMFLIGPTLIFLFAFLAVVPNMGYFYRFLIPVYPLIILMGAPGLDHIVRDFLRSKRFKPSILLFAILSLAVLFPLNIAIDQRGEVGPLYAARGYGLNLEKTHIRIGKLLAQSAPPYRYTVATYSDSGAIPFFSKWRNIDAGGLNDVAIARHGFSWDELLNKSPEVIVASVSFALADLHPTRLPFVSQISTKYELIGKYPFRADYWEFVYVRKDLRGQPDFEQLITDFGSDPLNWHMP